MNRSVTASVLIAIGIVLTLMGVLDGEWFGIREDHDAVAVGLREAEFCRELACSTKSLRSLPIDPMFSMSGNVAFFSGIIAAVLGALAACLRLAGVEVAGPVSPARMAAAMFGVTLVASLLFVGSKPDDLEALRMGMAGPLAIAGALFGAVGSVILVLEARAQTEPVRTELPTATALKAPAAMAPACPQCAAPLNWVAEHERWYCKRCRAYAVI
jgi:hypothetical protein